MDPQVHTLKAWPEYFDAIAKGNKNFTLRLNDRGFKLNDILVIRCYDPFLNKYRDCNSLYRRIEYILEGGQLGLELGYIVIGLKKEAGLFFIVNNIRDTTKKIKRKIDSWP